MPSTVTPRPKIDRPISAKEVAVIQAALEHAAKGPIAPDVTSSVPRLHAIAKCGCGCESVDFAPHDPANPSSPIADGLGTTSEGEEVGLIVWGRPDAITGLEVYALGGEGHRLPLPETIHGWDRQKT
jgi:hypothetical protein